MVRLLRPLLVDVEHLLRPSDQPRQVGHLADRPSRVEPGHEAQLGEVHVADAGQPGLVEQRVGQRAVGLLAQPAYGLVLVPVGAEQVGAEVADRRVLLLAGEQLDDAEREADGQPVVGGQHDPRRCRPDDASAGPACSCARTPPS